MKVPPGFSSSALKFNSHLSTLTHTYTHTCSKKQRAQHQELEYNMQQFSQAQTNTRGAHVPFFFYLSSFTLLCTNCEVIRFGLCLFDFTNFLLHTVSLHPCTQALFHILIFSPFPSSCFLFLTCFFLHYHFWVISSYCFFVHCCKKDGTLAF